MISFSGSSPMKTNYTPLEQDGIIEREEMTISSKKSEYQPRKVAPRSTASTVSEDDLNAKPLWRTSFDYIKEYLYENRRPVIAVLVIFSTILTVLFSFLSFGPCVNLVSMKAHPFNDITPKSNTTYRVVLFGDSVLAQPYSKYRMKRRISSDLPQYNIQFIDATIDNNKIADMRQRLYNDVLDLQPDAVIMVWDSDCRDVDESKLLDSEVIKLRGSYQSDLSHVVSAIVKSKVALAIGGPGLLGEGGTIFSSSASGNKFGDKNKMLDSYRLINQLVAAQYSVPYIDLRKGLQDSVPFYRMANSGCVTIDGEHCNNRGSVIISRLVTEKLHAFFTRKMKRTKA